MFGRNIPIKPDHGDGSTLNIVAIWKTIQGEGPFAGRPAIFIRLAGCNLKCFFCDTDFETGAHSATVKQITTEVLALTRETAISLVVLTGGEPLAQNVVPLARKLIDAGLEIQVETAGTVWQHGLNWLPVKIVCSPKTGNVHPMIANFCFDWKYVIRAGECSEDDGLPVRSTQEEGRAAKLYRPRAPLNTIWLAPCDEHGDMHARGRTLANMKECVKLAMKHGYRISVQTHKILGVD